MIKIQKSHVGLLHKSLGIPQGKPVPAADLMRAMHSKSPAVRKRAVFANNAKGWSHSK